MRDGSPSRSCRACARSSARSSTRARRESRAAPTEGGVALESFLLFDAGAFAAFGGVQSAFARAAVESYADRLARTSADADAGAARPLLLETSTLDPFHDANVALGDALRTRGVAVDVVVLPGPHDQPWLRRAGTPRLVAWLDGV